jgi:hypothetical protein
VESPIDYQQRVQDALRGLVARLLADVAEQGLPGEHSLYLSFRTRHPGVRVPAWLRDQHPDELNIVLQHQFWDLEVTPDAFSVTLSFNAARQRLTVPFAALTAFFDPVASFGLRFQAAGPVAVPDARRPPLPFPAEGAEGAGQEGPEAAAPAPEAAGGGGQGPGGEVVRFDPTRRK